ncbi:gag-proteinase polyprotein [Cucumis melo var. makuwa]|uniref:Gag-proteinase polyprotein n=1 Tax=Cucumis melo var. makuwa TaxID=1194695 RepID=A0A5D3E106_CUCMM|nr:gag-proteinase polyprotein [Cucumis melo var. makuwa]
MSQKKEGDRKIFRYRECGGVGHYQAERPTFLRKQKKNFRVTLSDEESVDSRDDDGNINAFAVRITYENIDDDSECSVESKNDELSIEKLETLWKEDCEARTIQKERIQDLLEENERLMSGELGSGFWWNQYKEERRFYMSRGRKERDLRGRLSFLPPISFGVVVPGLIIYLSTESGQAELPSGMRPLL